MIFADYELKKYKGLLESWEKNKINLEFKIKNLDEQNPTMDETTKQKQKLKYEQKLKNYPKLIEKTERRLKKIQTVKDILDKNLKIYDSDIICFPARYGVIREDCNRIFYYYKNNQLNTWLELIVYKDPERKEKFISIMTYCELLKDKYGTSPDFVYLNWWKPAEVEIKLHENFEWR